MKVFNSPHVIIFSNFPPNKSRASADRWVVTEITSEPLTEKGASPLS